MVAGLKSMKDNPPPVPRSDPGWDGKMTRIKPVKGEVRLSVPVPLTENPGGYRHIHKPMTKKDLLWLALKALQAAMETDDA